MKEKDHKSMSIQVFTPIVVYLHVHPTCRLKLQRSHFQMLQNLYLKGSKRKTKDHEGESALIEGTDTITILFAYSFIHEGTQDSPIRRWIELYKDIIKTTHFCRSRNNRRVNWIHPRIKSILLGLVSNFLWFLSHNALIFQM